MMNQKILTKIIATTLAMILTLANLTVLGLYTSKTYATNDSLEAQETFTKDGKLEFDAYYVEENKKTHSLERDINDDTLKLCISTNVKAGYLSNARIEIQGEDGASANIKINKTEEQLQAVEKIDDVNNQIMLKQLNSGTQSLVEIPVTSVKQEKFDLSNLEKINNIKLIGNYVNSKGETEQIEKTIKVRNKWIATRKC